jgi:hypothetical protein
MASWQWQQSTDQQEKQFDVATTVFISFSVVILLCIVLPIIYACLQYVADEVDANHPAVSNVQQKDRIPAYDPETALRGSANRCPTSSTVSATGRSTANATVITSRTPNVNRTPLQRLPSITGSSTVFATDVVRVTAPLSEYDGNFHTDATVVVVQLEPSAPIAMNTDSKMQAEF